MTRDLTRLEKHLFNSALKLEFVRKRRSWRIIVEETGSLRFQALRKLREYMGAGVKIDLYFLNGKIVVEGYNPDEKDPINRAIGELEMKLRCCAK